MTIVLREVTHSWRSCGRQQNRGYATAAVEASEVRGFVAHAPLERPESGRVVEKSGFTMVREVDDTDEAGNVLRVKEWELTA